VLDIGCGAGQELAPFVERGAVAVGIDVAAEVGRAGRELYASRGRPGAVAFVRGGAEALPFRDGAFDVVVCRLALPYMDNARAIAEMVRVVRAGGGVLLLQTHAVGWYLAELARSVRRARVLPAIHALRVLAAGTLYRLLGRQPRSWPAGGETFQTEGRVRREVERAGGALSRLAWSGAATPCYRVVKR
jgi:ubiquinone/menaquinone biosynthesis C-methylase UbiE